MTREVDGLTVIKRDFFITVLRQLYGPMVYTVVKSLGSYCI